MSSAFFFEIISLFVLFCLISCKRMEHCKLSDYEYEFVRQSQGVLPQDSDYVFFRFTTIRIGKSNANDVPEISRIVSMKERQQHSALNSPLLQVLPCLAEKDSVVITMKSSKDKDSNGNSQDIIRYELIVDSILTKEQYLLYLNNLKVLKDSEIQAYRDKKDKVEELVFDQLKKMNFADFENLDSGVRYKYLKKNPAGKESRKDLDIVTLTYYICLKDGTWIDDSFRSGQSLQYLSGSSYFMPFFNNTVNQLRENEEGIFIIPAAHVYDGKGFKGNITIPPGKDLVMYLKIDGVKESNHKGLY